MELSPDVPPVRGNLHNLNEIVFGIDPDALHPGCLKGVPEVVVDLVAVAVPLTDEIRSSIGGSRFAAFCQTAIVSSQPHCASEVCDVFLLLHHVYDVVWGDGVHLHAVGILEPKDVP